MENIKILDWIKSNKILVLVAVFLFVFLFLNIVFLFNRYGYDDYYESYEIDSFEPIGSQRDSFSAPDLEFFDYSRKDAIDSFSTKLDVKEGMLDIKSEDAESDLEVLKTLVSQEDGYIETSSRSESNILLLINAQVRVPIDNFDNFVEKSEQMFDVRDFNLSNYKLEVQQHIDELDIIQQALRDYDFLREETLKLKDGEERINLLASITTQMQNLARQQRELERTLVGREEQSDLATINVVFSQTLRPDLWPEDLGDVFYDRISWGLEEVGTIFASLLANSFVLIIKVLEYIVYAVIIIIPIRFVWNLFKRLNKKKKVV